MKVYLFKFFILLPAILLLSTNIILADDFDLSAGEDIFVANCSACHQGGQNVLQNAKTLEKDVLAQNGMNSVEAITKQVKNGKNQMPAFSNLSDDDVNNVANYVLNQSEIGW